MADLFRPAELVCIHTHGFKKTSATQSKDTSILFRFSLNCQCHRYRHLKGNHLTIRSSFRKTVFECKKKNGEREKVLWMEFWEKNISNDAESVLLPTKSRTVTECDIAPDCVTHATSFRNHNLNRGHSCFWFFFFFFLSVWYQRKLFLFNLFWIGEISTVDWLWIFTGARKSSFKTVFASKSILSVNMDEYGIALF